MKWGDPLTGAVIGAAIEVHKSLGGPGLRERIYEEALCQELRLRGLEAIRQLPLPIRYKGVQLRNPLIVDLLVERRLIIEVKATEENSPLHRSQLLTYLRLSGLPVGLLINFGGRLLKHGIVRVRSSLDLRRTLG
ncbi:MAG: GxxExxY protein [Parachlamydiales bacterium]